MDLPTLLEQFRQHTGLILGDVMIDEYISGECSRLSPEAPVPVMAVGSSRVVLGGAANTASNVRSLGGGAILVGRVGRDAAADQMRELARGLGLDFRPVVDASPTVRKIRVVGQQQQLLRLDYEATDRTDTQADRQILEIVQAELPRVSFVVISDYAKGFFNERLTRTIIAAARAAGRTVIVDPRPQHASFYQGCDYLTPNWKESLGLIGEPDRAMTGDAVSEVGRAAAARFGCHVLLTLGSHGMTLFSPAGERLVEQAAIAREVFDVSGAGDTVAAAFALAVASGADHETAVAVATRAAGVVVGKLGTATVMPNELLRGEDGWDRGLVERGDLRALVARLRDSRRRVVTINGSFDLLHAGHVHILREARRQGDVLIVGLNSDASIRRNKGAGRPFVAQDDRAALLLALRDVDFVHVFDEATPNAFLAEIAPDVHVNGAEYGDDCVEAETVRAGGGRLHLVSRIASLSTTDLAGRIADHVRRAAPVDGRGTVR
jgi:D-beta-D-heptose 7-phosphate kinase/D-beta-D-heptose 1-phosphate adenosyltransferase